MKLAFALIAALLFATPVEAEWLKARSRHFTIYSDTRPKDLTALATRLENVDAALRFISSSPDTAESAANPVTVYVVASADAVGRLARDRDAAGFYIPRADGAVAFTPRRGGGDGTLDPQIVLFHEYAHHFLLGGSSSAFPAWLSEGYAEFVATARVDAEGVLLGIAAQHRAHGLLAGEGLPIADVLAPKPRMTALQRDQIYSRGWLLTHMILMTPERRAKLGPYLVAVNSGVPPLKAATDSFGDLKALERDLRQYLRSRRLSGFKIGPDKLPAVTVEVRPATAGERALIDMRMISTRGVDRKEATALHARAARAIAPFADDPVAQGWFAEMAYDAGLDDAAEAAADRALAADPKSVQALLYKARVRLRRLSGKADDAPADWKKARSWIVKANRLDPDVAAPLKLFYESFQMEGARPSKSAVAGLHRALELAPQDADLRFRSVRQHLLDDQADQARRALRPLAFSPHAPADNPAARLLTLLDAGVTGQAALDRLEAEARAAAQPPAKPAT